MIGCRRGLQMSQVAFITVMKEEKTEVDGIYEESEPGYGQNESPRPNVVIF